MYGDMRIWQLVGEVERELLAARAKWERWSELVERPVERVDRPGSWVGSLRLRRVRLTLEVGRVA